MKTGIFFLLLGISLLTTPAMAEEPVSQGGWEGNLNLLLGAKALDEDDWLADSHGEVGLLLDFAPSGWPLSFAIDMLHSRGDFSGLVYSPSFGIRYAEEEVTTRELDLGVRHHMTVSPNMHPYFGGGLALVSLKAEWQLDGGPITRDEGNGSGLWLNGGIAWHFDQFNLGFDVRLTLADVDTDIGTTSGGGGHVGLLLGYHW